MEGGVMERSCHLGRGLSLLAEHEDGAELEGTCRLAPGRVVVVFGLAPVPARGRRAVVTSWRLVQTGSNGLIYRGTCEWLHAEGKQIPLEPVPARHPAQ
jgi:hypothetical protein